MDFGEQVVFRYRFDQVIAGALSESPHFVRLLILGRDHDYRNGRCLRVFIEHPHRLKTAHPRHDDIHQDDVGVFLAGEVDPVGAVIAAGGTVPVAFEHRFQDINVGRGIINDENMSHA